MALDKVVDSVVLDAGMKSVADAIRAKAGTTDLLEWPDGFKAAVEGIQTGGGGGTTSDVAMKDVNFYDYDGTLVASYTLAEAQALTALPPLPSHDGLICQGWNWTLADIKALGRAVTVGAMYITDDGKTRIYIRLEEGRTSPMLGVCPNGTVTVDWGDGTEPDTLTGTSVSTVKWTPTHEYGAAGDYVIKLTISGSVSFAGSSSSNQYSYLLRYSSVADTRNQVYQNAIQKVEIGVGVTSIGNNMFQNCYSLSSITIPDGVTSIGSNAFQNCYSLSRITIPDGVTSIGTYAFQSCYSLASITIPDGVTSIKESVFRYCYSLTNVTIPDSVTSISSYAFQYCYVLSRITIPDGVKYIDSAAFANCYSLASITIPDSVTYINSSTFANCYGMRYYDFSACTDIPSLLKTDTFKDIPSDCQMLIPEALYDEWSTATNWVQYASYMVAV